jgi:hypothetical protein
MKIAIVTLTTTPRITGVAEYLINLVNHLQELDHKSSTTTMSITYSREKIIVICFL